MFDVKYLFCFICLSGFVTTIRINFYSTAPVSKAEGENDALRHHCLRLAANIEQWNRNRQIISFCLSERPSTFKIEEIGSFPNFTFASMAKDNITSQQLYLWSASVDVAERYQWYLNQISTSTDLSSGEETFYNCTLPRFGPFCQYEFFYHQPEFTTLYEIIYYFFRTYMYLPKSLTCYTHLQCNRGPQPACLDWSEICDGHINCLDGGQDEEHCWQLDLNHCAENEYRCHNGQCIPEDFYQDDPNVPDCLDRTDDYNHELGITESNYRAEPSFGHEDVICRINPLTSACASLRGHLLSEAIFATKEESMSEECWAAFKCRSRIPDRDDSTCYYVCEDEQCDEIIQRMCPEMFFIPIIPVLSGDVYFAYQKNDSKYFHNYGTRYPFVCYNHSRYDEYFLHASKVVFNQTVCYRHENISGIYLGVSWDSKYLFFFQRHLWEYGQNFADLEMICNQSDMYRCEHSRKCIPHDRVRNGIVDCPRADDEETTTSFFENIAEDEALGIMFFMSDQLKWKLRYIRRTIFFQTICDGFIELAPIPIDGRNETDETECEQWQCNNLYTRCDGVWNCLNGLDELGCDSSPPIDCPSDEHLCVTLHSYELACLPIAKINDGEIDCLGATDEPTRCRTKYESTYKNNFYCSNRGFVVCVDSNELCNRKQYCIFGGHDEIYCQKNRTLPSFTSICHPKYVSTATPTEKFLCDFTKHADKPQLVYFSLNRSSNLLEDRVPSTENTLVPSLPEIQASYEHYHRCQRGLDLRIWLNRTNISTTRTCLCPPSFYGNTCQYQNQRVSLSIKIDALSDSWQTPFAIVISLIDNSTDQGIIHAFEQWTYLMMRDCHIKFSIYLLYSTRPKQTNKSYSIRIDILEKVSLIYRGSFEFSIPFPFLPVQRVALVMIIPGREEKIQRCSTLPCQHGRCLRYFNSLEPFCQCDHGWGGRYCSIPHNCTCAFDSLCLGVSIHHRPLCVCPINRFGSRCLLTNTVCQTGVNATCLHGGLCVPTDEYLESGEQFQCVCRKGFTGNRCEKQKMTLLFSFEKGIVVSQSVLFHFIEIMHNRQPNIRTTFQVNPRMKTSLKIYWSLPFHLVFVELADKNYYLAIVQQIYNRSSDMTRAIYPSDHCPHINQLFNQTIIQWHLLRRIKYYHLLCQRQSLNLSCFYDEMHLCLCYDHGHQRLANCLHFFHNRTFSCFGPNECQNDAPCFQDTLACPQSMMCGCPTCYHGRLCQFTTSGFGLTLDAILGYDILSNPSMIHQPAIVQISLVLTVVFTIVGLINGLVGSMTFKSKIVREVGCGLYLLGSSMTTLLVMTLFGLKFLILLFTQMSMISNRSFLSVQCYSMDFLLRVSLTMDQWLNACVAIERAMTVLVGTRFVKKKSKQAAKRVIIILLIFIIGTSIHDPFHRRLIDEDNDGDDEGDNDVKRIWCIVSYSARLQVYNRFIHILHFFAPFLINLISTIILVTKKSHQRSFAERDRSFKEILKEQINQHKHLFIAPLVLVTLALPRLIISYVSKCMKSTNDAWLYLIGYLISFIPSMLTSAIFILPSELYRNEFRKSISQLRHHLRRRLCLA